VAVDNAGNAYLTGRTKATNFPTTSGVIQSANKGSDDAFVTKLSADGTTLLFSTYLGGTKTDFGTGIAVDTDGNAYLIGNTQSTDFPTTANAYQKTLKGNSDPFIAKVSATGSDLLYATYLGGSANTVESGYAVAVDAGGYAFVTGLTSSTDFP